MEIIMIWTMGEMIVEIMREKENEPLSQTGTFLGPYPSGAPAIFADTAAKMGHQSGIIGCVGKDAFGEAVVERMKHDGVDTSLVTVDESVSTGCAFVMYWDNGDRVFLFHIGNAAAARATCPKEVPKADFFHVMGCSVMSNENFGKEIIKTMHAFRAKGAKISFDPNIRPEMMGNAALIHEILSVTNVLQPGVGELLSLYGKDTVEEAVKVAFQNENLEIIALKNGSKGCRIFTREESFEQGIYPIVPKDATGAGDSFDAAFLCGLVDGKSLRACAQQASAAAAINTAAFGPMEGKISPRAVAEMIQNA